MDFDSTSTTDQVLAGVDLSTRVALVTGSSGGLGAETARALAAAGAHVVMAARDDAKNEAAAATIRELHPAVSLRTLTLDLASLESVRAAARALVGEGRPIDLLINNAGVMCTPEGKTTDGFETQFGTNHLGHFELTCGLESLLCDHGPVRVVNLSSAGHQMGDVDLDDPNFERRPYDPWASYGQSKTANILFSVELDRRWQSRGVRAFAVHPGGIHTDLGRYMTREIVAQLMQRVQDSAGGGFQWKTIAQGAATSVWAATTPDLDGRGGLYLEDCSVARVRTDAEPGGVAPYAIDPARARQLWELSERMVER